MKCCNGCKIEALSDMGENGLCKKCYNIYMSEYRKKNRFRVNQITRDCVRAKRWLNGSDNYSGELA